jgi:hypothetical protein
MAKETPKPVNNGKSVVASHGGMVTLAPHGKSGVRVTVNSEANWPSSVSQCSLTLEEASDLHATLEALILHLAE